MVGEYVHGAAKDNASHEQTFPVTEVGAAVSGRPGDSTGDWFRFADAERDTRHQKWLVEGVLPSHGINMLYGPTGTGKSFIALDLAMCVGSGRDWFGHKVDKKPVLYFAGEGHSAEFHNRIRAARRHYGIAKGAHDLYADLVFKRFDIFGSSADRQLMDDHIERITKLYGSPPGLIIIDTFAACTPGMDEISGKDVGRVLGYLNRMAERSNAAILVIHHTGAAGVRERGHSSLAGDCVSIIRVDRNQLTVLKQREGSSGYSLGLTLKVVPLEDGISTCVVAKQSLETTASEGLRGKPSVAFDALVAVLNNETEADYANWRRACEIAELTPQDPKSDAFRVAFKRAKDNLVTLGFLEIEDEKVVRLTEKGVTERVLRQRKKPAKA